MDSFQVLYAKAGAKKRKQFADGTLRRHGTELWKLTAEDGTELWKLTDKNPTKYSVGAEISFGSYVVQIDEHIGSTGTTEAPPAKKPAYEASSVRSSNIFQSSKFVPPQTTSSSKPTGSSFVAPKSVDSFWDQNEEQASNSQVTQSIPSTNSSSAPLFRMLHSKPVATIPLSSVAGSSGTAPVRGAVRPNSQTAPVQQDPSLTRLMRPHQVVGADFLISRLLGQEVSGYDDAEEAHTVTGAILADEMGVGKTLTSISALWAFIRRGSCKCLVICPSSLVDNWLKEVKQWLGTKLKPLSLRPGADASAVINTFAISMASLYPLMVLSYEMYRKHATLLNTVPNLELMVCDEGHRLKNVGGTKTMEALSACKAKRRIILSGTPVQNDLDELYAVVSFVVPGFFGSLSEYQRRLAGPISRSNEENATPTAKEAGSAAAAHLRDLLGKIMLRRTQTDILSSLLPARHDYVVQLVPTQVQTAHYDTVASDVLRSIGVGEDAYDSEGEAEEVKGGLVNSSEVLAGLQKLRSICNSCAKQAALGSVAAGKSGAFASARDWSQQKENVGVGTVNRSGLTVGTASGNSAKLQFLMRFLTVLRRTSPEEKVVVVSNFTTSLDEIEAAVGGRWGESLRLDGKVPVDQRQALVNRFNKAEDPSFLFLLSAKAGGVGINLVGGSRLIMFDVDWNPAVDHQAMSRIWREGQLREVHIYRLVMAGTIEEAILQRQRSKRDLADMVEGPEGAEEGAGREQRMSLTTSDVLQLVYPHGRSGKPVVEEESREPPTCPVLGAVASELGPQTIAQVRLV